MRVGGTALFVEESLYRGLQWVVFEPDAELLWAKIRSTIGAFMHDLFRRGAFQGRDPEEAYFVRCDATTITQNDIDNGVAHIAVRFAPLKPAACVVVTRQLPGPTPDPSNHIIAERYFSACASARFS